MGRFVEVRGRFYEEGPNPRSLIINTAAIRWIDEKTHSVEFGDALGVWILTDESMRRLRTLIDLIPLSAEAVRPPAPYVTE